MDQPYLAIRSLESSETPLLNVDNMPFMCSFCNKNFQGIDRLQSHIKKDHEGEKTSKNANQSTETASNQKESKSHVELIKVSPPNQENGQLLKALNRDICKCFLRKFVVLIFCQMYIDMQN